MKLKKHGIFMVVKIMVMKMLAFFQNCFLYNKPKNYGRILLPHGTKCVFFRFFMVRGMV